MRPSVPTLKTSYKTINCGLSLSLSQTRKLQSVWLERGRETTREKPRIITGYHMGPLERKSWNPLRLIINVRGTLYRHIYQELRVLHAIKSTANSLSSILLRTWAKRVEAHHVVQGRTHPVLELVGDPPSGSAVFFFFYFFICVSLHDITCLVNVCYKCTPQQLVHVSAQKTIL